MDFKFSIESKKNLLAFSAGVDSSALFFLLLENNIPFDIAIVDYNQREQSKDEVAYAKELAQKYDKKIYLKEFPAHFKFSEKYARDFRYNFFDDILTQNGYEALITAHQLNDKLEWFLMQLSKGAGLAELLSFKEESKNDNYKILKPLLSYSKDDLKEYLERNSIKYFIDESNSDIKYKRNLFRQKWSNELITKYESGILKSFEYLENDLNSLGIEYNPLIHKAELIVFEKSSDDNLNIRIIDKEIKRRGYILSNLQRAEILKQKEAVIENFAISLTEDKIWISPYKVSNMDKKFKESCRVKKIPPKHRGYIYLNNLSELFI